MYKKLLFITIIIIGNVQYIITSERNAEIPPLQNADIPKFSAKTWTEVKHDPLKAYYMFSSVLMAYQLVELQQKNGSWKDKSTYVGTQILINGCINIGTGLMVGTAKGLITVIQDTYTRYRDWNKIEPLKKTVSTLETEYLRIAQERNKLQELLTQAIEINPDLLKKLLEKKTKAIPPLSTKEKNSNTTTPPPSSEIVSEA